MVVAAVSYVVAFVVSGLPVAVLAEGLVEGEAHIVTGPVQGDHSWWALAEFEETLVVLDFQTPVVDAHARRLQIEGVADGSAGRAMGRPHGGVVEVSAHRPVSNLLDSVGGNVSGHVVDRLHPLTDGRALLAGFLIGEVSGLAPPDVEAMRLSGLAHYVAVSGSNVALFLGLLFVISGPLSMGPRRRAVVGILGLPIYAAATKFEPSVMRASVMAGLALLGRLLGVVFEAWQLLSLAVVGLLVMEPALSRSVGFQLSVAATAGVIAGSRWPVRGLILRALAVTVGAQLAVAPLLLLHFGTIPLFSPVLNLLASPLVAAATITGAIGAIGVGPAVGVAAFLADSVLAIARFGARLPQIGPMGLGLVVGVTLAVCRWRRLLPAVTLAAAFAFAGTFLSPGGSVPIGVVVMDIGQGDSILVHGGNGLFALVDGGPDDALLREKLRQYGVSSLELVVLTHVHADHAAGLAGIEDLLPVRLVWEATDPHDSTAASSFLDSVSAPVATPAQGASLRLGELLVEVEGPIRRYASPNDQSVVITVTGPGRTMLLSGDIETYAQSDLQHLSADVLKVPHQGAATSDPDWLRGVGAELAVVSVGPNQFGHPAPWVIDLLEASGAEVLRTDRAGDVVVDLS